MSAGLSYGKKDSGYEKCDDGELCDKTYCRLFGAYSKQKNLPNDCPGDF